MDIPLLPDIVAIFCLSIGVLLVCHQVKIPPIVGFLLTGVLCGPTALGLVQNPHAVELLAEIGVVLLLFSIGLEMSGEELMRLKRPVFVGGTAQVVLTVGAFMCLGVLTGQTWQQSMMYGFLASLSSTAIVLSRLQQKAQSESPQGRLDFSVLIFQDIAVVPMMLAIPILAGRGDTDLGGMLVSAGRTLVILVGGWVLARHVVPRIMQLVLRTRSKELMLMTVLGLCFAIALGTASLSPSARSSPGSCSPDRNTASTSSKASSPSRTSSPACSSSPWVCCSTWASSCTIWTRCSSSRPCSSS